MSDTPAVVGGAAESERLAVGEGVTGRLYPAGPSTVMGQVPDERRMGGTVSVNHTVQEAHT